MYTATTLLFLSMPLILGSLYSLFIMLLYVPLIIIRIHHEEKILEASLPGYTEYQNRTKYRLIPLVW
jgi:protein-S-isoprenylcysteine O-methyltransferase Ste14